MKKGSVGITITIILVILIVLGSVGYFVFFKEKCAEDKIFNPYTEECVGKNIICSLDSDCSLLEGQTVSFYGENLFFTLISTKDNEGDPGVIVNINGLGETNIIRESNEFSFGNYTIVVESIDGDPDKIMGVDFEVTKSR